MKMRMQVQHDGHCAYCLAIACAEFVVHDQNLRSTSIQLGSLQEWTRWRVMRAQLPQYVVVCCEMVVGDWLVAHSMLAVVADAAVCDD